MSIESVQLEKSFKNLIVIGSTYKISNRINKPIYINIKDTNLE